MNVVNLFEHNSTVAHSILAYVGIKLLFFVFIDSSAAQSARPGDLIITEMMVDPTPSVGLPNTEWVEIYNASGDSFSLDGIDLLYRSSRFALPNYTMAADEYVVLMDADDAASFGDEVQVLGMIDFPRALANSGALLGLMFNNEVIHSVDYDLSFYNDPQRDDGGYSMEMIDIDRSCQVQDNWRASDHDLGGTPGATNSSGDSSLNIEEFIDVTVAGDSILMDLVKIDGVAEVSIIDLMVNGLRPAYTAQLIDQNQLNIIIEDNVLSDAMNELAIVFQYLNCHGAQEMLFVQRQIFTLGDVNLGDIVINEIMYRPAVGLPEFIEIVNTSSKIIDLGEMEIEVEGRRSIGLTEDRRLLFHSDYMVLSEDVHAMRDHYPWLNDSSLLQVDLPALRNTGNTVRLLSSLEGATIDEVVYFPEMHAPTLFDDVGVSLEKINPTKQGTRYWSSAMNDPWYATPGIDNSVYSAEEVSSVVSIDLSPVVSPDGDGFQDNLTLVVKTPSTEYRARADIFGVNGSRHDRWLNNEPIVFEENWSYTNVIVLKEGHYFMKIEVWNDSGDVVRSVKPFVIIHP